MVAVSSGVTPAPTQVRLHAPGLLTGLPELRQRPAQISRAARQGEQGFLPLPALAVALVVLPVFLQAPWVREAPMSAALFTVVLVTAGVLLERHPDRRWSELGALLVGFSGSWLGGCLFWGWCRLHPLWHLPIEAFALPLALAGLNGRWRLACAFYLSSLLGTGATDAAMAISGVMDLWPQVLSAPLQEAPLLLHNAGLAVLRPLPLAVVAMSAALLLGLCSLLRRLGTAGRMASVTLATTLAVDGLFLAAALASPSLSGLI